MRVLGEARLEALTKVVERGLTVCGYGVLVWMGSTSVTAFTTAFLIGALAGWALALFWALRTRAAATQSRQAAGNFLRQAAEIPCKRE